MKESLFTLPSGESVNASAFRAGIESRPPHKRPSVPRSGQPPLYKTGISCTGRFPVGTTGRAVSGQPPAQDAAYSGCFSCAPDGFGPLFAPTCAERCGGAVRRNTAAGAGLPRACSDSAAAVAAARLAEAAGWLGYRFCDASGGRAFPGASGPAWYGSPEAAGMLPAAVLTGLGVVHAEREAARRPVVRVSVSLAAFPGAVPERPPEPAAAEPSRVYPAPPCTSPLPAAAAPPPGESGGVRPQCRDSTAARLADDALRLCRSLTAGAGVEAARDFTAAPRAGTLLNGACVVDAVFDMSMD